MMLTFRFVFPQREHLTTMRDSFGLLMIIADYCVLYGCTCELIETRHA